MIRKVGRRQRPTPAGEIIGAGADDPAHLADPPCGKAAIGERPDPQGDVDMIADEIDIAVAQRKLHVNLRKGRQKLRHHRRHMQPAEHQRRGKAEFAARGHELARDGPLGLADLRQNPPARRDIGRPRSVSASRRVERVSSRAPR